MVTVRSALAALLLLVFVLAAPGAVPPAQASHLTAIPLSGVTRDPAGAALGGVEIILLSDAKGGEALLRAVSDERGRFLLAALAPGVYRIAAIKAGYVASLGRVNTMLRTSVDLVLRPQPKPGELGSDKVLEDMSWTLRVPPRGILREVEASTLLASRETGGFRALAARIEDSVQGEVNHMIAMGSWRPSGDTSTASLAGMETTMRIGGSLGEHGAIQVRGRRGNLDSSSSHTNGAALTRDAADVDVAVSYNTSDDASLAMNAFYSRGDIQVGADPGSAQLGARQGQRSWGYDASWNQQVGATSRLAVQVGYHDANLDVADPGAVWDSSLKDASNRAIGASGSYELAAGAGHLVRVGLRAQQLSLSAPDARVARATETFPMSGADGASVLMDAGDQWSLTEPWALTYGLTVRQAFDGAGGTLITPRAGGTWTASRLKAHAEVSYLAAAGQAGSLTRVEPASWSPVGYDVLVETPLSPTAVVRGSASYTPLRAGNWAVGSAGPGVEDMYVTDGMVSDQNVALTIERAAAVSVSFRVAHGRADGALAPAFDSDMPVNFLSETRLTYDAARFGTRASRSGSAVALEYRSTRQDGSLATDPMHGEPLRTLEVQFSQDLVRLGGGRATCRLLLSGRTVVDSSYPTGDVSGEEARRFAALHERVLAGLQLSF